MKNTFRLKSHLILFSLILQFFFSRQKCNNGPPWYCWMRDFVTLWFYERCCRRDTARKMKFSIKDFFSSQLLKKSLMENFILCAGCGYLNYYNAGEFQMFSKENACWNILCVKMTSLLILLMAWRFVLGKRPWCWNQTTLGSLPDWFHIDFTLSTHQYFSPDFKLVLLPQYFDRLYGCNFLNPPTYFSLCKTSGRFEICDRILKWILDILYRLFLLFLIRKVSPQVTE